MKPRRFCLLLLVIIFLLAGCSSANPTPPTVTPLDPTLSVTEIFQATQTPAQTPTETQRPTPDPLVSVVSQWSSASPDGLWLARGIFTTPKESDQAGKTYASVHAGKRNVEEWTLFEGWLGEGLGHTTPQALYWSPDSRYFYYTDRPVVEGCKALPVNGSNLIRVDMQNGAIRELLPPQATNLALSPDDTRLAYIAQGSLNLVIRELSTSQERTLDLDPGWDFDAGGIVWSPDGSALALTLANQPCAGATPTSGPYAASTTILTVDATSLAFQIVLEGDVARRVTGAWKTPNQIELKDPAGNPWVLDSVNGKTTPGYCAQLARSYQAPQGFVTFCDPDFNFAFDYPQAWGGLLKVESQQLDPVETTLLVTLKSRTFSTPDATVLLNSDTFFRSAGEIVNHYWSYSQDVQESSGYGEMLLAGKPAYAILNPNPCDVCSASVDVQFQHGDFFTVMSSEISGFEDLETFWQIIRSIQAPGKTPHDNSIPDALVQDTNTLIRKPGSEWLAPDLRIGNGTITALAVSPDGRWLVIGTPFGIHLYNANSFKEAWFVPLSGKTEELAFDSQGKRLGVASAGDILLFDITSGDLLRILTDAGSNFAFSPDGARLVSGAGCHRVTVWDAESGKALKELRGDECSEGYSGIHVTWAADGRIYAAAMGAQIMAWDGSSYTPLEDFSAEGGSDTLVSSLLAAPTGNLLAQYDLMGRPVVAVIDGEKNRRIQLLDSAVNGGISVLAWAPDGRRLAVAYGMQTGLIQIWDARTGQVEQQFEGYPSTVGLGWSADGGTLYGPGTLDGKLHALSVRSGRVLRSLDGHIPAQTFLSWTQADGLVSTDGVTITWWDAVHGTSLRQENAGSAFESVISWPPTGPATLLFNSSGPAHQVGTLSTRQPLEGETNQYPFPTAWSADGKRLADPSHVWDAESGRLLATLRDLAQRHTPDRVAWAPDGLRLASADSLNMQPPVIWDARNGQVLLSLQAETGQRDPLWLGLAWSPDGSQLAAVGGLMAVSGEDDGMILLWDANTGRQERLQTAGLHGLRLWGAVWSPDGRYLACTTTGNELILWDSRDGSIRINATAHRDIIDAVGWSPDGRRLATVARDGIIQIWDISR